MTAFRRIVFGPKPTPTPAPRPRPDYEANVAAKWRD